LGKIGLVGAEIFAFEFEINLMKMFSSLAQRLRSHFVFAEKFWKLMETSGFVDAEVSGMVVLGEGSVVGFSFGRFCREIIQLKVLLTSERGRFSSARKVLLPM
jgi:hypothetical protein